MAGNEKGGKCCRNSSIASSWLLVESFGASKEIVDDNTAILQRENTHLETQEADPVQVATPVMRQASSRHNLKIEMHWARAVCF